MTTQQDKEHLGDWVAETHESIAARLEGVKSAQSQTRLTLGTMAVISLMMLIASYNAYLSYDYNWIVAQKCLNEEARADSDPKKQPLTDALRDHAIKEWASSRTVTLTLLGIRVSVDDAAVLGTAVLFVLSLWLFLLARRENHTTGFLLRDTDTPDVSGPSPPGARAAGGKPALYVDGERWLIYHTIISNSLFITFDRLQNVGSLGGPNSLESGVAVEVDEKERRSRLSRLGLRIARNFFFLFPAFVALAVFIIDRMSYYQLPDPFSPNCATEGSSGFFKQSTVFFLVCFFPLLICCWKSSVMSRNTEKVLDKYGAKLLRHLLGQKQAPKS